jgi:cytochrome c oxidase subunit 3
MNKFAAGPYIVLAGFAVLLFMLFGWFGRVIDESEGGKYNRQVDKSFRWGMSWFIFSEVMFFAAFFGALFYIRVLAVPDLASAEQQLLWPTSRRTGRAPDRNSPSSSRRWARWGFRSSIPCCCCLPGRP